MEEQDRYTLVVPVVPSEQGIDLKLPMQRILVAEKRAEEVAIITPGKAPELLTTLNRAYLDVSDFYAKLRYERDRAEDEMNKIRAEILIDKIPDILKTKGLTSSADVRSAIIDADPAYQEARERVAFIEATLEYLKGKMKFFENSYTSVKKIMDTSNWNMNYEGSKGQRNGFVDETLEVGQTQGGRNFGKPR